MQRSKRWFGGLLMVGAASGLLVQVASAGLPQREGQREQQQQAGESQTALGEFLKSADLTDEQKQRIQEVNRKYDQQIQQKAQQFQQAHFRVINYESTMLAALQDHVPEAQRQEFQQNLQQHFRQKSGQQQSGQQQPGQQQPGQQQSGQQQPGQQQAGQQRRQQQSGQQSGGTIVVAAVQQATQPLGLSQQQQQQIQQLGQQYSQQLQQQWQELHAQHFQLVQLQAERLGEIEQVLTDDQLQQLREQRKQPPSSGQGSSRPQQQRSQQQQNRGNQ